MYTNEKDVLGLEFLPLKGQSDTVSPNLKIFSKAFWYVVKHCVTNNMYWDNGKLASFVSHLGKV